MADTAAATQPRANVAEYTVSELSGAIKRALEEGFGYVRLRGEVSGYRGPHASGHCYFALKDDKAKIEAVVWRSAWSKLRIRPEEGMEVIATGRVSSFPGSSKYQIVIEALEPAGLGALMAQLEERKKRLAAEGLFEQARKRPLPFLPRVVGIVTSPTGAVIRDMLHGFSERFPTHVIVWPVRVQGEGSAAEVAAAIRGFNAILPGGLVPRPEVLIVARGGGSLEDLWGFNDEIVVRAVAASALPVISAVGHETDWTLIDLVADARAPTPTKAAEWAVPKQSDLIEGTGKLALRLGVCVRRGLEAHRRELRAAARGLPRAEDLVALPRQRLDGAASRLRGSLMSRVERCHTRFAQVSGRLPAPRALVANVRQRFDAIDGRLGRGLVGNTRAHHTRHVRIATRLQPRLLETRIARARDRLDGFGRRNLECLARATATRRSRFERSAGRLQPGALAQRLERSAERLGVMEARARQATLNSVRHRRRALDGSGKLLGSLGYRSVLARGYALLRDAAGNAVRSVAGISAGDRLEIELRDGRIDATASQVRPEAPLTEPEAPDAKPARETRETRRRGGSGQGSLF